MPRAAADTEMPGERDPEMVLNDVLQGYVSIDIARSEYRVAIDPATFEIDEEETGKLRQ